MGADRAGAGLTLEEAAHIVDLDVAGTGVEIEGQTLGGGDLIVDGDVVVEAAVLRGEIADVNLVAGVGDWWICGDLAHALIDVAAGVPASVDVALDVHFRV